MNEHESTPTTPQSSDTRKRSFATKAGLAIAGAGLIGSATKRARFRSRLVQKGHAPAAIDRISCPIGTPELGKEPAAIAVGAAHRLLMELAKKEAQGPNAEQGAE